MRTQLCLLSGELMPNVIGVLYERPERIMPVVTKQSAYQVRTSRLRCSRRNAPPKSSHRLPFCHTI